MPASWAGLQMHHDILNSFIHFEVLRAKADAEEDGDLSQHGGFHVSSEEQRRVELRGEEWSDLLDLPEIFFEDGVGKEEKPGDQSVRAD